MNRAQKAEEIQKLKENFSKSKLTVLANYRGLTVSELTELRVKLREKSSEFRIVKNRLAKLAIAETDHDKISDQFVDATAVLTTTEDPTGSAKVLMDFAKEHEKLTVKVGVFGGEIIEESGLKNLASMPSKEELIAKLLGSMQAPAQNLVGVLSQLPRQVVQVLSAVKAYKEENE